MTLYFALDIIKISHISIPNINLIDELISYFITKRPATKTLRTRVSIHKLNLPSKKMEKPINNESRRKRAMVRVFPLLR